MSALKLYIGSKNLSSWSLRPWLFLKHHNIPFTERVIALDRPDTREKILEHSPSGRVPALVDADLRICESQAICEYAAERFELPHAWPADLATRAQARAFALEMHSGFAALRRELPFSATRDPAAKAVSDDARADIARVCAIWREARERHGQAGPWLFGEFGIVDAMFAPVALRFEAYAVELGRIERTYMYTVLAHRAVQQWIDAAVLEGQPTQRIEAPATTSQEPVERVAAAKSDEIQTARPMPGIEVAATMPQEPPVPVAVAPAKKEAQVPRLRSVIMPAD